MSNSDRDAERLAHLLARTVGLCTRCVHARRTTTARGSTFWRCGLADDDPRFPKYPRLPVFACPGFTD